MGFLDGCYRAEDTDEKWGSVRNLLVSYREGRFLSRDQCRFLARMDSLNPEKYRKLRAEIG